MQTSLRSLLTSTLAAYLAQRPDLPQVHSEVDDQTPEPPYVLVRIAEIAPIAPGESEIHEGRIIVAARTPETDQAAAAEALADRLRAAFAPEEIPGLFGFAASRDLVLSALYPLESDVQIDDHGWVIGQALHVIAEAGQPHETFSPAP